MNTNIAPAPVRYEIGSWVYLNYRYSPKDNRKVTVIGYDAQGYTLFAEGWIDVKATDSGNITWKAPEEA